jgi:hypothetical protein
LLNARTSSDLRETVTVYLLDVEMEV